MHRHHIISLAASLGLAAAPANTRAMDVTASNESLTVRYDDTNQVFTISAKSADKPFLTEGRLAANSMKAETKPASHPIFGGGQAVVITQIDGGLVTLALYQKTPFVFVTQQASNKATSAIDIRKITPATFAIDLGKPAAELVTMGTGGLQAPDKNPGSYYFLTVADPATRNGVVAGWLTQDRGSGTFFPSVKDNLVSCAAQLEHGHLFLPPGASAPLDTFVIGWFPDARLGLERFADAVRVNYGIRLRPARATYCSWYAEGRGHGRAGTPESTIELSHFIAKELKPYGLGVIQIDDGWQAGPQIGGPATEFDRVGKDHAYHDGIAPVADALAKDGITFGLWWLPFGRNHMQPDYKNRQDWFVKKTDGTPLRQHSFGGTCLDCTNPQVLDHLANVSRTIRSWGVGYYKMDGISVGAGLDHVYINDGYKDDHFGDCLPLHDHTKTNIEAMRQGLRAIRDAAGKDVFFSGCCAVQNMRTYAGTIGLVDSMRVGPDFNHDGEGIRSGPLRGSRMYFMNGKIWWNDPDPTKVRTSAENCEGDASINGAVTLEQARLTSSWVSLTGQFFLVSDWLPNLPQERLEVLRRTLAHHDATARPVDYFDHALANTWLVSDDRSGTRRDVIGLFNFYGKPLDIDYACAKLGLAEGKGYHAFDFWANTLLDDITGSLKSSVPPNSCRVIAVRAVDCHPVVISTSRHVTQGMIDLTDESWDAKAAALSGESALIANDPYELRIAGLHDGPGPWQATKVTVTPADAAAGVTTASETAQNLLRVTIKSPNTRKVKWSVTFGEESKTIVPQS